MSSTISLYFFGTILAILLIGVGAVPFRKIDDEDDLPVGLCLLFSFLVWVLIGVVVFLAVLAFTEAPAETLGIISALGFCGLASTAYFFRDKLHLSNIRLPKISISRAKKKAQALPEFNPDRYVVGAWLGAEESIARNK